MVHASPIGDPHKVNPFNSACSFFFPEHLEKILSTCQWMDSILIISWESGYGNNEGYCNCLQLFVLWEGKGEYSWMNCHNIMFHVH